MAMSLSHEVAGQVSGDAERVKSFNRPGAAQRELIVVIDYGSQYSLLIARRVREIGVYCEIVPHETAYEHLTRLNPKGIILSGGPSSVYDAGSPQLDERVLALGIPVLGICYGAQLIVKQHGGTVEPSKNREYGRASIVLSLSDKILNQFGTGAQVWMSHGDEIVDPGQGADVIARSNDGLIAAVRFPGKIYGVQFHPEVHHTPNGKNFLSAFARDVCHCSEEWSADEFIEDTVQWIRDRVGDGRILCALSGGVDSGVAASLVHRAVGDQLTCVFIDNGLLRAREADECRNVFAKHLAMDVRFVDAEDDFYAALEGLSDPEEKRRAIGTAFMEAFEKIAPSLGDAGFFAQGTTYPDVVESAGDSKRHSAAAAKIKTHHNVGGLPETMKLDLLDPLSFLFKDEVRSVGRKLGLPPEIVERHPFPGPGLAVRIIGEVTRERAEMLRKADDIFISELRRQGLYGTVSQALCVLTPIKSVGVMGDARTYENVLALRAVTTEDWMTADWARLPYEFLDDVSGMIVSQVAGINRVVYDITSKPPATVEWE